MNETVTTSQNKSKRCQWFNDCLSGHCGRHFNILQGFSKRIPIYCTLFNFCEYRWFYFPTLVRKYGCNPTGRMNDWLVCCMAGWLQHLTPLLNTTPPSAAGHYCSGNMLNYSITSSLHFLQDAQSLVKITERVYVCVCGGGSLYWWCGHMKHLSLWVDVLYSSGHDLH